MGLQKVQFGLRVTYAESTTAREGTEKKAVLLCLSQDLEGSAVSVRGYSQLLGWDTGRVRSTISSGSRRNKENAWYSRANSQLDFSIAFSFFRGREIQLCLRKYVYFCCEGNVAWFIFVYKVSIFHFSKWKGGKADRERLLWGKFFFSSLSLFFKKLNCSRGQSWPWTLKKYWDDRKSLCWRSRDRYASDFIHSVAHRQSLVQSPPQI